MRDLLVGTGLSVAIVVIYTGFFLAFRPTITRFFDWSMKCESDTLGFLALVGGCVLFAVVVIWGLYGLFALLGIDV
jgi:hypothetical protein